MVNVNNVLRKPSNFEMGVNINDTSDLKFIFECNNIHYIELCVPVVQTRYLEDNLNFFENLFNLEEDELKYLINCDAYIIVNPKEITRYVKGEIIEKNKYIRLIEESGNGVIDALSGGEAFKYLIDEYVTDENKRFLNFLLIDRLPIYYVSPKYPDINLIEYYDYIIHRNQRIPKMIEKKAPELILIHEKWLLQRKIDKLISVLLNV